MKRVLLIFLTVLLAVTFILAVYFYAENRELQSQGKVRVFSLKKWLQDFSEVEFPEYDLESWYSDRYGFTVGETFTYSDLYDRIESMADRTIWDKLFMSRMGWKMAKRMELNDSADLAISGDFSSARTIVIFSKSFRVVPVENTYSQRSDVVFVSTILEPDFTDKIEYFFIFAFDVIKSIGNLAKCLVPYDDYVVIDIPNQTDVSSLVHGSGVLYSINSARFSEFGVFLSSPSCVEWYKGSTGELLCKGYECETLGTPNANINFAIQNAFYDRMSGKIYVYLLESGGE